MDERTVLRRAKEVLLERGWWQGSYCPDPQGLTGPVCLEGAIRVALVGNTRSEVHGGDFVDAMFALPVGDISVYNDAPDRTFTDVIALIDKAIASLEVETPELVA